VGLNVPDAILDDGRFSGDNYWRLWVIAEENNDVTPLAACQPQSRSEPTHS
jgi:hypothetical protein